MDDAKTQVGDANKSSGSGSHGSQAADPNSQNAHTRRSHAVKAAHAMSDQLDENLRAMSAGGLALSLTVFKLVSSAPESWTICFLVGAWLAFAGALLFVTLSLWVSKGVFAWTIAECDRPNQQGKQPQPENPYNRHVRFCNGVAMGCFIVGIVSFLIFTIGNVHQMSGG